MKKKLLITFGIIALIGIIGGIWFSNNWHRLPSIIRDFKNPVAENQPTTWQDGPTTRTADKPNIVVIMVDDMGFNEVSTYGGGMANGQLKTPNIDGQLMMPRPWVLLRFLICLQLYRNGRGLLRFGIRQSRLLNG